MLTINVTLMVVSAGPMIDQHSAFLWPWQHQPYPHHALPSDAGPLGQLYMLHPQVRPRVSILAGHLYMHVLLLGDSITAPCCLWGMVIVQSNQASHSIVCFTIVKKHYHSLRGMTSMCYMLFAWPSKHIRERLHGMVVMCKTFQ